MDQIAARKVAIAVVEEVSEPRSELCELWKDSNREEGGRRRKRGGREAAGAAVLLWTLSTGRMVEQRNYRKRRETVRKAHLRLFPCPRGVAPCQKAPARESNRSQACSFSTA